MGRHLDPPRLLRWGPKGQRSWYAFYPDRPAGKTIRKSCAALGATDEESRTELLRRLRLADKAALEIQHGLRAPDAFQTQLIKALDLFLDDVKVRAAVRETNPGTREGLSKEAAYTSTLCVTTFKTWLETRSALECQHLDGPTLQAFFDWLSTRKKITTGTANAYRDKIKACLRWLDSRRPRLFPDAAIFWRALRNLPMPTREGFAYTPRQLKAFRKACKPKLRRLFLLIALTGCRRKEAVSLLWNDVDLARGRITIRSTKTGRTRIVPLTGAPEGEVAPGLVERIKRWPRSKLSRKHATRLCGFVHFPRKRWEQTGKVRPQALRRSFTSYAASIGIPASVCALWQGHRADVADRFYRLQVLERLDASSLEAAMGL